MGKKIALATNDRLTVHIHFGRAEKFHIVEFSDDGESWEYTDVREVRPSCEASGHNAEVFDRTIEMLRDCDAVVVGKIGSGAAQYTSSRGLLVLEAPGATERIIPGMAKFLHRKPQTKDRSES